MYEIRLRLLIRLFIKILRLLIRLFAQLDKALDELYDWCILNRLTLHLEKAEVMGPVAPIHIGTDAKEWVKKYRLLGTTVDNKLSWVPHMLDLKKSFAKKLDLIRRSRFLPKKSLDLLKQADWHPLGYSYKLGLLKLMHKAFHDELPQVLSNNSVIKSATGYSLRTPDSLTVARFSSTYGKNSIAYRGSVLWNALIFKDKNFSKHKL